MHLIFLVFVSIPCVVAHGKEDQWWKCALISICIWISILIAVLVYWLWKRRSKKDAYSVSHILFPQRERVLTPQRQSLLTEAEDAKEVCDSVAKEVCDSVVENGAGDRQTVISANTQVTYIEEDMNDIGGFIAYTRKKFMYIK